MTIAGCDDSALTRPADVAVIGSGPVGLKVAFDLADAGFDVILIESGRDDFDPGIQSLSDAQLANPATHAELALSVRRQLGGTSRLWGGRAVPFEPIDFAPRPILDGVRWPISNDDVLPWYETACAFLDCGPASFTQTWPDARPDPVEGLRLDRLERWCAHPDMRRVHGSRLAAHPKIRLALGTTVRRIEIDEAGAVTGLAVTRDGRNMVLSARSYIVAAGGIETARLLLESRADRPALFGGPDGALGRFYMGHAFGSIADIQFLKPGDDARFDFQKDASGRYIRRRFQLDDATQAKLGVMNMSAWPELPELHDPVHGNAILSLAYLALAMPVIGPRLISEAIRRRKLGDGPLRPFPHLWNVVKGAPSAALFAGRFMAARYGSSVRLPGFFVRNAARRYALHFHSEHAPDADSRVTLSEARDAVGMRRLNVDLRFAEKDATSIVATHDALDERLKAAGIAEIRHRFAPEARIEAVLAQASDGFHQIGTARMAERPQDGVVDANAQVHGTSNLFLAGSSIFPTSGQANPTLLAVALAARLAQHVKTTQRARPVT